MAKQKETTGSEEKTKDNSPKGWKPPDASETTHSLVLDGDSFSYTARADWIQLQEDDTPVAAMFHVAYTKDECDVSTRPLTFLFNGGPGAASAYLHVGSVGPKRVAFSPNGEVLAPPVRLVDNEDSWLGSSDLVFVDPIGTGFSRVLKGSKQEREEATRAFWEVKKDLTSLCEFITRFLTKHKRWTSPVFLAGESYGGFRVAALVKMLQNDYGVGVNGAALISPAIELSSLVGSDYSLLNYCDMFPSMAASAFHHKRVAEEYRSETIESFLSKAEAFAQEKLVLLLVQGSAMSTAKREEIFSEMAKLTGLSIAFLKERGGRVSLEQFCRELLRDEKRVLAFHDGALSSVDPFASRDSQEGPDAALSMTSRVFTSGINAQIREVLGVETEQEYCLLNMAANAAWKDSTRAHFVLNSTGTMDDLRFGMALNPFMKVIVFHGFQDLVTPYFASKRLLQSIQLDPSLEKNIVLKHYFGGHMYYAWEASRKAFRQDVDAFYADATAHLR